MKTSVNINVDKNALKILLDFIDSKAITLFNMQRIIISGENALHRILCKSKIYYDSIENVSIDKDCV